MDRIARVFFCEQKRTPIERESRRKRYECRALVLYNDGMHLYSRVGGSYAHLLYRLYRRETQVANIPGACFFESNVLFKTFGHTRNGSVIVSVREKSANWAITVEVYSNACIAIDEFNSSIRVSRLY